MDDDMKQHISMKSTGTVWTASFAWIRWQKQNNDENTLMSTMTRRFSFLDHHLHTIDTPICGMEHTCQHLHPKFLG
jgi:hypothetical protein